MSTFFDSFDAIMPNVTDMRIGYDTFNWSSSPWMNTSSMSDSIKTNANMTWDWVYNNVLIDKLDRIVYHGLMTSYNWTAAAFKEMNLEERARDVDWRMVFGFMAFYFTALWFMNRRMTSAKPSPSDLRLIYDFKPRAINITFYDDVDSISSLEGFTKPKRRGKGRAARLDADILNCLSADAVSARALRSLLRASYPDITLSQIHSRLYTMLDENRVSRTNDEIPLWMRV